VSELPRILEANAGYAARFEPKPNVVARRLAVLACMDARFDPARALGLHEGDAHVIRNAGGVATEDALRSLVVSHWRLGTREALVVGHTDCGMATFTDEEMHRRLAEETGAAEASNLRFLTFTDVEERVRESVGVLRASPLLPDAYTITGLVFDVETGRLHVLDAVSRAGAGNG
jgi:carbonic anhydrase